MATPVFGDQQSLPSGVIASPNGNLTTRMQPNPSVLLSAPVVRRVRHWQGLQLRWFPRRHLYAEIEADYNGPLDVGNLDHVVLDYVGGSLEHAEVTRTTVRQEGGMNFEVRALGVEFGTSEALEALTLHVVNFPDLPGEYVRDSEAHHLWGGPLSSWHKVGGSSLMSLSTMGTPSNNSGHRAATS